MLVPAGRLADRYGIKLVFLLGLATFVLGSLGCALSDDLWLLVGLRCLQAVGRRRSGAYQSRPAADRHAARAGSRLDPDLVGDDRAWVPRQDLPLGGLLVQSSWRWIFVINIPVGLIALALTIIWAPSTVTAPRPASPPTSAVAGC